MNGLVGLVLEGRYLVEAELGRGSMGVVYRGRHVTLGRRVAIKVLHAELVQRPTMVARFQREALIAAKLHHPNVVGVLDVGVTPHGEHFLVMELANGRSLTDLIEQGPVAPTRVVALALQLLSGLAHAHATGSIHRDLKPDNIIVDRDEEGREVPRIVDFGIAILHGDHPAHEVHDAGARARFNTAGLVLGTPAYMAPEQATGQPLDPTVDLFALGMIMYELLAGTLPFDGDSDIDLARKNMTLAPPSFAARARVAVPPALETFVQVLMARRRDARFASARAARVALVAVASRIAAASEVVFLAAVPTLIIEPRRRSQPVAVAPTPTRLAVGSWPPPVGDPERVPPVANRLDDAVLALQLRRSHAERSA